MQARVRLFLAGSPLTLAVANRSSDSSPRHGLLHQQQRPRRDARRARRHLPERQLHPAFLRSVQSLLSRGDRARPPPPLGHPHQAHARGRLARSDFLNRRWRLECELKAVRLQAAARGNLARSKLRESEAALQSSLDALLTSNVEPLDDEAELWAATTQGREGASSGTARVKEAREYSRRQQELVVRRAPASSTASSSTSAGAKGREAAAAACSTRWRRSPPSSRR